MSEQQKKEIRKILQREKLRAIIYPVATASFLYGLWLILFPGILNTYRVYSLINQVITHWQVGSIFVLLSLVTIFSFRFGHRMALLYTSVLLQMVWTMFAVSFLLSPPPNTVWIFAATMAYLSFTLCRRV